MPGERLPATLPCAEWQPPKPFLTYPKASQQRAAQYFAAMRAYWEARDAGASDGEATRAALAELAAQRGVPTPTGYALVSESPQDKAERMFATMAAQGRTLMLPADGDIAVLLHSVKRVMATPNGISTTVQPFGKLLYWSEGSRALRESADVLGAQKTFLALYNPVSPDALYLLDPKANPPGSVPAGLLELPENFAPRLYETVPLFRAPSAVDPEALARQRAKTQSFNASKLREAAVAMAPILAARQEEREAVAERFGALDVALRSAEPPVAPSPLPVTCLGSELHEAKHGLAAVAARVEAERAVEAKLSAYGEALRRREVREAAADELAEFQARHGAPGVPAEEADPEIF